MEAAQAVEVALARVRERPEGSKLSVEVADLPVVTADPEFRVDVYEELIGNAFDHAGPATITVDARRRENGWELVVEDDGDGIEPECHERVLEPFERLARSGYAEHAGLGLARVRRIVERHGGSLEIRSEPGEGTTVAFTLPDQPDDESERASESVGVGDRGAAQA